MRRPSLTRRILVIASIAIACAFVVFTLVIDQRQRALAKADIEQNLLAQGGLAARAVSDWLGGRVLLTQQVAVAVARTPAQPLAAL